MFPRFETFTKISFLLLNLQFRTSYPSFPLPTFKLPTSILNFPLIFSLSFKFEAFEFFSIFFPIHLLPSNGRKITNPRLQYWITAGREKMVDRAEHEGVKLVRLGWVIDQGRTLDIASLSMFDSTCRDNNIARFVNHKWRESDLSDFGVASRIPGKGKSIQTVKV